MESCSACSFIFLSSSCKVLDLTLDALAIERKLVGMFPYIYGLIMDALHALIEERVRKGKSIKDLNELLKDSSQHIDKLMVS
ncbi:hypothetical protein V2J09_005885 [Rumex salicifolius]